MAGPHSGRQRGVDAPRPGRPGADGPRASGRAGRRHARAARDRAAAARGDGRCAGGPGADLPVSAPLLGRRGGRRRSVRIGGEVRRARRALEADRGTRGGDARAVRSRARPGRADQPGRRGARAHRAAACADRRVAGTLERTRHRRPGALRGRSGAAARDGVRGVIGRFGHARIRGGRRPARCAPRTRVALALALLAAVGASGCGGERPRPDVLLVTIDTLRPDWIHAYGFDKETSPHIDALAARGVVFDRAIAAASLTAPAHASIMTSRYVREHSIGPLNGETRLEGVGTLAERFRAAGYETAAFVGNVVLRRRSGLDRGFDVYDDDLSEGELNRKAYFERIAADTGARAIEWLRGRGEGPVFLWLHLQDPHGPYTPPAGYRDRIGPVPLRLTRPLDVLDDNTGKAGIPAYQKLGQERDPAVYAGRYGEELLYADAWVGEVVAALEQHATERGSVVLLTADHGESMGELGWYFQHGHATTPDLVRIPFIVVAPGVAPARVSSLVHH
ncbi:MAG TPA: hypothetical protein ENO23_02545, partial [Alphaproteobacteria bacterium]|nr:hypothetical protein [Alphaproteobacteria bacterium]